MSGRTQRKKRKKKQARKATRGVAVTDSNVRELPRPLRLAVESFDLFQDYLRASAGDPAAAADAALVDACQGANQLARLAEEFDAFDVLECIRLSQMPMNPSAYKETEHEGMAALIEFAALVLAARGHRAGATREGGDRPRPDAAMEEMLQVCDTAIAAGSMAAPLRAAATSDPGAPVQLGALSREIYVRNLSYTHMVEDTLNGIFGNPDVESDCQAVLGFSVPDVLAAFHALVRMHEREWNLRFAKLGDLANLAQTEMAQAEAQGDDYAIAPATKAEGLRLWDAIWTNPGDCSTFGIEEVAAEAGVERAAVERILDVFSVGMSARSAADAASEFFEGRSPFRTRPLLRDPEGAFVVVHQGLLVPAIRERVEEELKVTGRWERYAKRRGDYLESEALRLLGTNFTHAAVHHGLEYFVPATDGEQGEQPAKYTKLVEGDGLLVLDDLAVIVEAKAGALSALSRTGDARRLDSDLRKIVTAASDQTNRLRRRITEDGGLRLRDGYWLDLRHVHEIHAIAVSLEDLSGIATVTSDLVQNGILSGAHLPWTVSLHDLRIVTELVERPAELLLYLRRRTEPDVTRRFHAVDELDFFLEFYASGLYVEPDPDRVHAELPQLGEPSVAARRRFQRQKPELLTSRTDQLDAWYFYQLGIRRGPVAKPRLNINSDLVPLVDALAKRRDAGWLRMSTTLLDGSASTQRKFSEYAVDLLQLSKRDGQPHTIALVGGSRRDNSFVMIWRSMGRSEDLATAHEHLSRYVRAKKYQLQVAWGGGLLFVEDPDTPIAVAYDNRPWGVDPQLDDLVASMGLKTPDQMASTVRRPGRQSQGRKKRR